MSLINLFWAFLKTGALGFGGGQAMIPLIENETVTRYNLISATEFYETVALSNALPGPIATKLAVAIGYETSGLLGSLVALIAVILPSSIGIIIVFQLLNRFSDIPFVRGIQEAAKPLVAALIIGVGISLTVSLGQSVGWTYNSRNLVIGLIFIGVLILYILSVYTKINIPTALIVIATLILGGLFLK